MEFSFCNPSPPCCAIFIQTGENVCQIVIGRSPTSECNLEFSVLFYDKLVGKKYIQGNKERRSVPSAQQTLACAVGHRKGQAIEKKGKREGDWGERVRDCYAR